MLIKYFCWITRRLGKRKERRSEKKKKKEEREGKATGCHVNQHPNNSLCALRMGAVVLGAFSGADRPNHSPAQVSSPANSQGQEAWRERERGNSTLFLQLSHFSSSQQNGGEEKNKRLHGMRLLLPERRGCRESYLRASNAACCAWP